MSHVSLLELRSKGNKLPQPRDTASSTPTVGVNNRFERKARIKQTRRTLWLCQFMGRVQHMGRAPLTLPSTLFSVLLLPQPHARNP